jgi:predicted alpha/beta superfamily hydrolase
MKTRLTILVLILICSQCTVFAQTNDEISIGQKVQVDSKVYDKSRELFISLPQDYNDSAKTYPVMYILFPRITFGRAKSAAEYLEGNNGIPGLILVGIGSEDTWNEMFPFPLDRKPTAGGGDKFMSYIKTEVIPFVESNYRTDSLRILTGFSNSAMFANYVMIHEPDLFKSFILSSPMIGWGDDYVLKETIEFFSNIQSFDKTVYMIYGDKDYDNVTIPMPRLETFLKDKAPKDFKWKIDVLENEGHVPYVDIYNGLVFTFEKLNKK